MIRHVLTIPSGIVKIRFQAYAALAEGNDPDKRLDVVLAGADQRPLKKTVRTGAGWITAKQLLARWEGKPRDYEWNVADRAGQRMQIVILDQDDRPGSHVYCSGFTLVAGDESQDNDFAQAMLALTKKHKLASMARYDSKRFAAYSNASDSFTTLRLRQCEIFYDLFYNHFARKGFAMHHPAQRLMLAVFDGPDGVDAYLGAKLPAGITGMYHPVTNRLLLYDLSENRALVAQKKKALDDANKIAAGSARTRIRGFGRTAHGSHGQGREPHNHDARDGPPAILQLRPTEPKRRYGDLAGGRVGLLLRSHRIRGMAGHRRGQFWTHPRSCPAQGKFIPLQILVKEDWRNGQPVLLGYAQSWALFHMLMQQRPQAMKAYLDQIYSRRTADYRLADFRQAFGNDLAAFEQRYFAYLRELIASK